MGVEEVFDSLMQSWCELWMQDRERVRKFILEEMRRMIERMQEPDWNNFSKTAGWTAMRRMMTSEQQFKFHKIWGESYKAITGNVED